MKDFNENKLMKNAKKNEIITVPLKSYGSWKNSDFFSLFLLSEKKKKIMVTENENTIKV